MVTIIIIVFVLFIITVFIILLCLVFYFIVFILIYIIYYCYYRGPCNSVGITTELPGWTVRDRIPVGTRFSARPDRPWGPSSLL